MAGKKYFLKKIKIDSVVSVATVSKSGVPNIIAAEICKINADGSLVLTDNHMNQTVKNIKENKNIALLYHYKDLWWKLIGTTEYFTSGKWLDIVRKLPTNKGYQPKGVLIIRVKKIDDLETGKTIARF
ncbi:MAG: pyridoxamine 5'-phosphate oxidase family protein [Patescibacteria group bacterium]|jgi:hypothetical protein